MYSRSGQPASDVPRVLAVDDSATDLELLRNALEAAAHPPAVELEQDPRAALARLRDTTQPRPDIVVADLNMTGMTGLELLAELRYDEDAELRRLPVVVFTASTDAADIVGAYDLHASAVVAKPTAFESFAEAVLCICRFWLRTARLPSAV